jgi:outer membrane protein OmpA-like peptidoglycan-associated protein
MASLMALRGLVAAGIGLGSLDLAWINFALGPRVIEPGAAPAHARAEPRVIATPIVEPAAEPAAEPAPEHVAAAPAVSEPVYFSTLSRRLDHVATEILRRIVERAAPDATIVLEGHADHRGDEALNRELSKQRAVSVARQLEKLGIERSRIRVGYVGEDETVDGTELWRARRVDIQITGGP